MGHEYKHTFSCCCYPPKSDLISVLPALFEDSSTAEQLVMMDITSVPGYETFSHTDSKIPTYVPSDNMSTAAWSHCVEHLPNTIYHHSLRVFLLARCLQAISAESSINPPLPAVQHVTEPSSNDSISAYGPEGMNDSSHRRSLLFIACMFHDFGTVCNTSSMTRFEIEGADAAVRFLRNYPNVIPDEKKEVWQAIALHSTPQIPERMGGLVELVRQAVRIDFRSDGVFDGHVERRSWADFFDSLLERGPIEQELGDAVVEQAIVHPKKAPNACWPGGLLRWRQAHSEAVGVNGAF